MYPLHPVSRLLYVVCCMPCAVCCVLYASARCCMLHVVPCILAASCIHCMPTHVVRCTLPAARCPLPHVVCRTLSAARCHLQLRCLLHVVCSTMSAARCHLQLRCLLHVVCSTMSAARSPLHVVCSVQPHSVYHTLHAAPSCLHARRESHMLSMRASASGKASRWCG